MTTTNDDKLSHECMLLWAMRIHGSFHGACEYLEGAYPGGDAPGYWNHVLEQVNFEMRNRGLPLVPLVHPELALALNAAPIHLTPEMVHDRWMLTHELSDPERDAVATVKKLGQLPEDFGRGHVEPRHEPADYSKPPFVDEYGNDIPF